MKKKAHKRYLKKSTRVDEEKKKQATRKYFFMQTVLDLH